jgi:hypothetical protein
MKQLFLIPRSSINSYESVTISPQTHWNRPTVLFVSGSDHAALDARFPRLMQVITLILLLLVAFLRL